MQQSERLLPFEEKQKTKKVLIKAEAMTDERYGSRPESRSTEELLKRGIIVLDKPSGPTSHQAADYLKRVLHVSKAGHSGTLDPGVTGVLPIALQESTRITNALLTAGKEYVCLMHVHQDIPREKLMEVLNKFKGKITQLPPKKSAVKRQLRDRNIYYLDVLEIKDKDVLFVVGCQAGTYIRKLVHDIGERLGCGAHMAELRRTKAGPFKENQAFILQDIADAFHYYKNGDDSKLRKMLMPIESATQHLEKIWVHDAAINTMCHGAFLKVPGILKLDSDIKRGDIVAVMSLKNELILIGEAEMNSGELMKKEKGIAVKTLQVFMQPEAYPKYQ